MLSLDKNIHIVKKGMCSMNIEKYLSITPEIAEAVKAGKPVVALESTILSHGMPYQIGRAHV